MADVIIGLYNPFKYGKETYEDYNIKKLKGYCRFMEMLEDRWYGSAGNICPLFFNGAAPDFEELPRPDNQAELQQVYEYVAYLESQKMNRPASTLFMLYTRIKHLLTFKHK